MNLDEMTQDQLKAQVVTGAKIMAKMTTEVGYLNGEKIQLGVQLELRDEHIASIEQENQRLLGVIEELKESQKNAE